MDQIRQKIMEVQVLFREEEELWNDYVQELLLNENIWEQFIDLLENVENDESVNRERIIIEEEPRARKQPKKKLNERKSVKRLTRSTKRLRKNSKSARKNK